MLYTTITSEEQHQDYCLKREALGDRLSTPETQRQIRQLNLLIYNWRNGVKPVTEESPEAPAPDPTKETKLHKIYMRNYMKERRKNGAKK